MPSHVSRRNRVVDAEVVVLMADAAPCRGPSVDAIELNAVSVAPTRSFSLVLTQSTQAFIETRITLEPHPPLSLPRGFADIHKGHTGRKC